MPDQTISGSGMIPGRVPLVISRPRVYRVDQVKYGCPTFNIEWSSSLLVPVQAGSPPTSPKMRSNLTQREKEALNRQFLHSQWTLDNPDFSNKHRRTHAITHTRPFWPCIAYSTQYIKYSSLTIIKKRRRHKSALIMYLRNARPDEQGRWSWMISLSAPQNCRLQGKQFQRNPKDLSWLTYCNIAWVVWSGGHSTSAGEESDSQIVPSSTPLSRSSSTSSGVPSRHKPIMRIRGLYDWSRLLSSHRRICMAVPADTFYTQQTQKKKHAINNQIGLDHGPIRNTLFGPRLFWNEAYVNKHNGEIVVNVWVYFNAGWANCRLYPVGRQLLNEDLYGDWSRI